MGSGWFWAGAAVGLGARRLRKDKLAAEEQARLMAQARAIRVDPISPPLPLESWFTGGSVFRLALPRNFVTNPASDRNWRQHRPLLVVEDGVTDRGMWLAVLENANLLMEVDPAISPWMMVVQPAAFCAFVRQWGGSVINGPTPILVGGEEGVWASISMKEEGHEVRKWVAFSKHRGASYEAVMSFDLAAESTYASAFWTAIGSWQWLDQVHTSLPNPTAGRGTSASPGLVSPDGRFWWDGGQWRPLPGRDDAPAEATRPPT